jgi:hypothetical protein
MIGMDAKFDADGGGTVISTAQAQLIPAAQTLDWHVLRGAR